MGEGEAATRGHPSPSWAWGLWVLGVTCLLPPGLGRGPTRDPSEVQPPSKAALWHSGDHEAGSEGPVPFPPSPDIGPTGPADPGR